MQNHRLTIAAATAVLAAALSLYSVLMGNGWMAAAIGATAAVAAAGTLSRMDSRRAGIASTVAVGVGFAGWLAGYGWLGSLVALALGAATVWSATGARLPRLVAVPATYAGLLLVYLTAVFAPTKAIGWVVPTAPSVMRLASLFSAAVAQSRNATPPVPDGRPVEFVAAAGIGAIAVVVDLLAVRLRRPALAGVPLAVLFSVPLASNLKAFGPFQALTFAAAAGAYLALLSAEGKERFRVWGRLVALGQVTRREDERGPDTRELRASGRRVGLAAIGVAMVAPVILSGSKPHDFFKHLGLSIGGPSQASAQLSPLQRVGPLLNSKPEVVFTYQTSAADPRQQYFGADVLNYNSHSDSWLTVSSAIIRVRSHQLPEPVPGLDTSVTPVERVTTTAEFAKFDSGLLPLPYAPVRISVPGAKLTEAAGSLMVADLTGRQNLHVTVVSSEPEPSKNELSTAALPPTSIEKAYGSYTGPDANQLQRIAVEHAGSGTLLRQAVSLQDWFQSGAFIYSTRPDMGAARGWLLRFLTTNRRGDCEQFAPAFAVLARLIGIPSRVVLGYTGGVPLNRSSWQVTSKDAHAWPELYFPDVGWIRFEPTPTAERGQGTASVPPYTQGKLPALRTNAVSPGPTGPSTRPRRTTPSRPVRPVPSPGPSLGRPMRAGHRVGIGILAAIMIFLLLALPAVARWLTGRRRWITAAGDAALAHAAWRELCDYLTDYGLSAPLSESPRATARRLADAMRTTSAAAQDAVRRIGAAQERAEYSLSTLPGGGLRMDVLQVRKALAATCSTPQRLRARLLPISTLAAVRARMQFASRALGWLDQPQ